MTYLVILKNTYSNKIQYSKKSLRPCEEVDSMYRKKLFSDKPREKPLWKIKLII